jgi:excisionase family DNA binding protein
MSNNIDSRSARFMDVQEAARFLNVSTRTLYGWASQGRVPYRKAGRRLLFLESELLEWTKPNYTRPQYLELTGR